MTGAVLLVTAGTTESWADFSLAIAPFGSCTNLVFQTPDHYTFHHHYRVECSTSLVLAAWSCVSTVGGVGGGMKVTNTVTSPARTAFYRVVATSNSADTVDGHYMVIDVSEGTNAASYPVMYYTTSNAVPGGIRAGAYKTTRILMRHIPKGTYAMGSPTNELGRDADEVQHQVALTEDFYIGVFEVTQTQWERVMGNWPSYFTNTLYRDSRPVERVSYYEIRENPLPVVNQYSKGSAISPHWPQSSEVHADSFIGKLRAKTTLSTLDLPTEAQWEYACRAGTTTALNSGYDLTSTSSDPQMDVVGRYWYNGGLGSSQSSTPSEGTALVGSYSANPWGLYDMHGNVSEWCLDWYGTYPGAVTDPQGAASGAERIRRGGSWNYGFDERRAAYCRSAYRSLYHPQSRSGFNLGFRLAMTLH